MSKPLRFVCVNCGADAKNVRLACHKCGRGTGWTLWTPELAARLRAKWATASLPLFAEVAS